MKICPNCQESVVDTAKFCNRCGFNIQKYEKEQESKNKYCTECGAELLPNSAFCIECGKELSSLSDSFDFGALGSIENVAKEQLKEQQAQKLLSKWKIGTEKDFGSYLQVFGSEREPISWIVIANEGLKVLLISKYAIDMKRFNEFQANMTWENCTLRRWLNNEFLNNAFNENEKSKILEATLENEDNSLYNTIGGDSTRDKVFILSVNEASKYLTSYELLRAKFKNSERSCFYWLRSPGYNQFNATFVSSSGQIDTSGYIVNVNCNAVRPCIWLSLEELE